MARLLAGDAGDPLQVVGVLHVHVYAVLSACRAPRVPSGQPDQRPALLAARAFHLRTRNASQRRPMRARVRSARGRANDSRHASQRNPMRTRVRSTARTPVRASQRRPMRAGEWD